MKKTFVLVLFFLLVATLSFADEITFSFISSGNAVDVTGSPSGFMAGPATEVLVSDSTKGLSFPLAGVFTSSAGAATAFNVSLTEVTAEFSAGGPKSVLIVNPSLAPIVSGNMLKGSDLLASYPGGTGSFAGTFNVTFVDPTILAMFGLGPKVDSRGSVGITFGEDQLVGGALDGTIGGGVVTVVVNTSTPEVATIFLVGSGVVLLYLGRNKLVA